MHPLSLSYLLCHDRLGDLDWLLILLSTKRER